ncbi:hypothetical protein KJ707_00490 [Patescibacteria group bacterium]|nr:hypothetical protein [Patescibacteria group bacterium]MBU1967262.1 hypothetical protein [Patescibacteria group bacterium]MBU2543034.1 hypothetical protein [Patescibacteria group bacterium]
MVIEIDDLQIDRRNLSIFGQEKVPGLNNEEDLDSILTRALTAVYELFSDQVLVDEFLKQANAQIEQYDSSPQLAEIESSAKELLEALKDLAVQAKIGNKAGVMSVLNRMSQLSLQDSIARSGGLVKSVFFDSSRSDTGCDTKNVVNAIIELSQIKYASQHGGRMYITADEKEKLETAKTRAATTRVS